MSAPSIVVVIRENPTETHRAAEALRIALGLSTGNNPLTIVLLGNAPVLLTEDTDDIVDGDILEKHLPVLKELKIRFVVQTGVPERLALDDGWALQEASVYEIAQLVADADRALVF